MSMKHQQVLNFLEKKFEPKLLVWICISQKGISKPYFVPSGLGINQHVYLKECIQKRLIPFIQQHHLEDDYVFWPDLASSHYAKTVIDYLREKNVKFLEKEDNPANVPECRAIENFWRILKGDVYKNNWKAENLEKLQCRIKYCLKKIDLVTVQNLANSTPKKLDSVRRYGLIEQK